MRITKRFARKEALLAGFRSKFELDFSKKVKSIHKKAEYEAEKLSYTQPEQVKNYIPDWKIREKVFIETKGLLDSAGRKKILLVIKCNPDIKLYLLFQNSKLTLSKKSKTTYGDWASKNNIEWSDIKNITKWRKWFNE